MNPNRPFGGAGTRPEARPAVQPAPAAAPAVQAPVAARGFDLQAMQRIEANRQRHGKLRDLRVRALGDVERFEAEAARDAAVVTEKYGTADLDELRARFAGARAKVSAEIDEYEAAIGSVEDQLRTLGEQV